MADYILLSMLLISEAQNAKFIAVQRVHVLPIDITVTFNLKLRTRPLTTHAFCSCPISASYCPLITVYKLQILKHLFLNKFFPVFVTQLTGLKPINLPINRLTNPFMVCKRKYIFQKLTLSLC